MSKRLGQTQAIQTVSRYVCSVCWGRLEWGQDGVVRCQAYGDDHQGFVTSAYAERRRQVSRQEAAEVTHTLIQVGVLPNPHAGKSSAELLSKLGF